METPATFYEILTHLDYWSASDACRANRQLFHSCYTDPLIRNLLRKKYQQATKQLYLFLKKSSWSTLVSHPHLSYLVRHGLHLEKVNPHLILNLSIEHDRKDLLNLALEYSSPRPEDIIKAIHKNNIDILKMLLSTGINPAFNKNQALHLAQKLGFTKIAQLLFSDPRVSGMEKSLAATLMI